MMPPPARDPKRQPAVGDKLKKGRIHKVVRQLWVANNGTKMLTVVDREGQKTTTRYPTLNQFVKWAAEAQVIEASKTEAYWK